MLTDTCVQMSGSFADISRITMRTAVLIHHARLQKGIDPVFEWEKTFDWKIILENYF